MSVYISWIIYLILATYMKHKYFIPIIFLKKQYRNLPELLQNVNVMGRTGKGCYFLNKGRIYLRPLTYRKYQQKERTPLFILSLLTLCQYIRDWRGANWLLLMKRKYGLKLNTARHLPHSSNNFKEVKDTGIKES